MALFPRVLAASCLCGHALAFRQKSLALKLDPHFAESSRMESEGERKELGGALAWGIEPAIPASNIQLLDSSQEQFPSNIMTCPTGSVSTTPCMTHDQYDQIMGNVSDILSNLDSTCNIDMCPQADWAGCVLRMAGHDFMDFQWGEGGGSDGCIDFSDTDNQGLKPCLTTGAFHHQGIGNITLLSVYQQFCSQISLADFFVLAGEAVMTHTRRNAGVSEVPHFKASFQYGRTTAEACSFAHGRLPNPDAGCKATEEVFLKNLDLTWEDSAALMGVHTVGRAHRDNSGFHGWWSDPENSRKFNNNYYVSLLSKAWGATAVEGSSRHQYDRVDLGAKGQKSPGNEMMLNTDMCLAFSDVPAGEAVSISSCTCTWVMPNKFMNVVEAMPNRTWCGTDSLFTLDEITEDAGTQACCPGGSDTCDDIDQPRGVAVDHVQRFAANDTAWFDALVAAWSKATTMGYAHQPGILLQLKNTCSDADVARQAPIVTFPSTTTTSTTTTTVAEVIVSDTTLRRWYLAASMESCSRTCQRNAKQCNQESWAAYGHEVDTYAKMSALVSELTGLDRSQNPGAEKAFYRTYDGKHLKNFSSMGGGTTATARRLYTGSQTSRAGIGHPWNQGFSCAEDVGAADTFMTPAVHYIGSLGPGYQCRYNIPNRSYPLNQCERHYHGASWRRLCPCDDTEAPSNVAPDTTACLRLGKPDPECCSRPIEASCAPGFEYSIGQICMWTHDNDYFTTECRQVDATTTTTTLPSIAEGFFLGPQGEGNCTSICEERHMTCTAQGFRESYDQISNYTIVSSIVDAIGQRDWLGIEREANYPQCQRNGGYHGYRLWPATWGTSCPYWQGDVPDNHCAPGNPGGGYRRLCKCTATTTTTTLVPAGYMVVGNDAMCTDEAMTAWNEGIEIGQWPRSQQSDVQACAQRCDITPACNAFVYWNATSHNPGHCRTYRECSRLACQTCNEYRGSVAIKRLAAS